MPNVHPWDTFCHSRPIGNVVIDFLLLGLFLTSCVVFWVILSRSHRRADTAEERNRLLQEELERTRNKQNVEHLALEEERKRSEILRKEVESLSSRTEEEQQRLRDALTSLDAERAELEAAPKRLEIDRAQLDQDRLQFDEEKKNAGRLVESRTTETQPEEVETENASAPPIQDSPELGDVKNPEVQAHREENPLSPEESKTQLGQTDDDTIKQPPPVESDSPKEGTRTVEPEKRGGRPRGEEPKARGDSSASTPQQRRRVGIICKKYDWQWHVGLELPEELQFVESIQVYQQDNLIERDTPITGFWALPHPGGTIHVRWIEGDIEKCVDLNIDESDLVFKLQGEQGRLVKKVSSGSYAVFVPESWERDEAASGPATIQPENAAWPGYKVHFFDFQSDQNPSVVFRSKDGSDQTVTENLNVELVGSLIPDAHDNVALLFGDSVPFLQSSSVRSALQIKTVVLGEEGSGNDRWRTSFPWTDGSLRTDLPEALASRGSGWYFVRLYDADDSLIGTLDFRFVPGLQSIQVERSSDLDGIPAAVITFSHNTELSISLADSTTVPTELARDDETTKAIVHCNSAAEETTWLISQGLGAQVKVKVDLSTLSWGLGNETEPPTEWDDHTLVFPREMFKPTSAQCLWVRFPRSAGVTKALAGFQRYRASEYRVKAGRRTLKINLRDFSEANEVLDKSPAQFQIWWESANDSQAAHLDTMVVGMIPRVVTTYHCIIDNCSFVTTEFEQLYHHADASHDKVRHLDVVDDYDEFLRHYRKELGNEWPTKIYRCGHCNAYVRADDELLNPGDVIYRHLMDEHTGQKHMFSIVRSVDEVRTEVISSLPKLYRCKHGDAYIEDRDVQGAWHHFLTAHRDEFVCIKVSEDISRSPE